MKKTVYIIVLLTSFFAATLIHAQGVSRSQGVGLRLNFWNITGGRTSVSYDVTLGETKVDLSGTGASIYYFSRAYRDLFLEMSLGAISGGEIKSKDYGMSDDIKVETIMPFLVGLRYDFLSSRVSGAIHPYVSLGGGPYTAFDIESRNEMTPIGDEQFSGQGNVETRMEYGWYWGGGVNFVFASWFALNADLKYNLIDFPDIKDYSGMSIGIGTVFMWGKKKSIYEIRNIQLVSSEIYPVSYQSYRDMPIALVTVKNLAGHPIEVNIHGRVKGYTDRAKESGFVRINGGDTGDVPVHVFFSRHLMENENNNAVILEMDVEVRAATTHRHCAPINDAGLLPKSL